MMSCTYGCLRNVINLGNSIIGVSILAMPYCFQKCGILLSFLLIILSGILVRAACYLLLKGAVMARRRNFEYLAFHAMGSSGKLAVEIGVIGFLIGVCIAFFVVIGDLGPPLASEYFMIDNSSNLRAEVLIFLGAFVALPLGLLRKVDSLTSLSFLSIAFYVCLIVKIFVEASARLVSKEWMYEVNWWKSDGFLPCLPIFSMALSCQTQLFEFFDTLNEPSVKRMTSVVNGAVYLCSVVYMSVGLFGYIACHDKVITGNILVNLMPSMLTEFIKLGFIVTVVISFPLCLFPCRTSLHSLLFKQGLGHHDIAVNFIPDHRFRVLTISLVVVTVGISIMLPNIEFVLSIVGSTIGTAICFIFPAVIYIHDSDKNTTEKRIAQAVLFAGMFILVACTYTTLRQGNESHPKPLLPKNPLIVPQQPSINHLPLDATISSISLHSPSKANRIISLKETDNKLKKLDDTSEKRQEPPEPQEPVVKIGKHYPISDIDPQAFQKEDKEIQKESLGYGVRSSKPSDAGTLKKEQEQILRQLQKQQKEQQIILEQQKQVLEELKLHKEAHDEAVREEGIKKTSEVEKQINLQENNNHVPLGGDNIIIGKNSLQILSKPDVPIKSLSITSLPSKQSGPVDGKLGKELVINSKNINSLSQSIAPHIMGNSKVGNIVSKNEKSSQSYDTGINKVNYQSLAKNLSLPRVITENRKELESLNTKNIHLQAINSRVMTENDQKKNNSSIKSKDNVLSISISDKTQQNQNNSSVVNAVNIESAHIDKEKPEMR